MLSSIDIENNVTRFLDHNSALVTGRVIWQAIQFTAKEKAMALPSSFTRGSSMNLVAPKLVDTTDRSLVEAFSSVFRPGADGSILERPMFYLTPYITCDKCNSLMFVDAAKALTFGAAVPDEVREHGNEADEFISVCPGCASTANFRLGAHDFLADIAGSKAELIKQIKVRHTAALLVGRLPRVLETRVHKTESDSSDRSKATINRTA